MRVHFTRRHFANGRTLAAILAPSDGREVWFANSADFHHLRLDLATHGAGEVVAETGERFLSPGETWHGSALLSARIGSE